MWVHKHQVQCVIKRRGQSRSSQSFWQCYPALSFSLLPCLFDQGDGLPFSDSSPSTAVVKFTSKFKWRPTLPALNLFPFQTSTLKIYSVSDKQDAAALEPWRSWKLTSFYFSLVSLGQEPCSVLTLSQQLPLKTQSLLWQTAGTHGKNTKKNQQNYRFPWNCSSYIAFELLSHIKSHISKSKECLSYHFILRPALLYQFGYWLLHQALESFACIVAALMKLWTITEKNKKH